MVAEELGINLPSIGTGIETALIVIFGLFIAAIIVIAFFIIRFLLSYNIKCVIEEHREHGIFIDVRRGKITFNKKDKGNPVERIRMLGVKNSWPIMPPTFLLETTENVPEKWYKSLYGTTRKGKMAIRLMKDGNQYTVIPWSDDKNVEYLRITKPTRLQWANAMLRESAEVFPEEKGFMEKYGHYVAFGATLMVILVIFIILFDKFDTLAGISDAITTHAKSVTEYAQSLKEFNTQPIK